MRWIILVSLLMFNVFVLLKASTYFLVTTADIPIKGTTLSSCSPDIIATAIGHAKHNGSNDMQNYLLRGAMWLISALVVNFLTAAIAMLLTRHARML